MNRLRVMMLSFVLLAAAPASLVAAQDERGEDAASSRSAAFEAAHGAHVEQVPGGALLVGAYGVVWVLLLGYVVLLGFRQARVGRELERLREDLSSRPREEQ